MIGIKVIHATLGEGTIIEHTGDYVIVEFPTKTCKFRYPSAFENFLTTKKPEVQQQIMDLILAARKAEEEAAAKAAAEEAARRAEAAERERLAREAAVQQRANRVRNHADSHHQDERIQRVGDERMIFFVFQGNTFDREYAGGYLWAPIENSTPTPPHHWTRLLDVREGDIILHGCNGYVQAISIAKGPCYPCLQPKELATEGLWDLQGRKVDCEYTYINNPIKTSDFIPDIIRLSTAKYSPFDRNGSGNMGYLYVINPDLAKIFVQESVKLNPSLASIPYIRALI